MDFQLHLFTVGFECSEILLQNPFGLDS